MTPRLIFDPSEFGRMRVACFMSGSGTNVTKIIEYEHELRNKFGNCPFETVVIFTDNEGSKAQILSERFGLPCVCRDILEFYKARGHDTKHDLSLRPEYDTETVGFLVKYRAHAIALCGYMSILTHPLLKGFGDRIFNVHPADLSLRRENGTRKYVGAHAVLDAILGGEKLLYSTTHIVREEVDHGEILMRSMPIPVSYPRGMTPQELGKPENRAKLEEMARFHQEQLKEKGDWFIYPLTLRMISEGRYGIDPSGNIYVDGKLMPFGYRL